MESITANKPLSNLPKARIIAGIVIALVFPLVMAALLRASHLSYWNKVYGSRLIFWVEVGLLWLYARKVEKQNLLIWPKKSDGLEFLLSSVVILYLLALAAQLIAAIPALLGYHENSTLMKLIAATVKGRPALIVFISFTAGFCEEVIFRGYVLTRLSQLCKNKNIPVLISSLMFAALHYRYHSLREFIFPFLIGIIMSVHYQRFGNIKPLIIVHFIIDFIGLTLASHYLK